MCGVRLLETGHRSRWPGGLLVLLDYVSHQKRSEGTSPGEGLQGAWRGPAVDKHSFNSWWSGPLRGQWSPLWKPLVQQCLSPWCLHKAKVLCDCLQALLFCFVCLLLLLTLTAFFPFCFHGTAGDLGGGVRGVGVWSYPDFTLAPCVEVWLASSFVCFFPGTFPSPVCSNSCLQSACTSPSLTTAVGGWITLQEIVWQVEAVAFVHTFQKPCRRDQFDLLLII